MKLRLLPRSLLGQVMLVMALGLLVGQAISGVLLFRAADQRREAGAVSHIVLRLVAEDERRAWREAMQAEGRALGRVPERAGRAERRRHLRPRRGGIMRTESSPLAPGEARLPRLEQALREALGAQGIAAGRIEIGQRRAADDPVIAARPRWRARLGPGEWGERMILVAGIERADGAGWDVVRLPRPERPRRALGTIVFQTLVIFAVLFALLFIALRRITRPLARLTERVSDFSRRPDAAVSLPESGPEDLRRLIAAHNAMEARIAAMLDEKDVMLGAIGHDLKTPLAALRVRIENVADEEQRRRMAASIEEINRTLDDILELARIGRPGEAIERTELGALVASLAQEYEDMGKPVALGEVERIALPLRPGLLRRAIRNLVDNALRYGRSARIEVLRAEGEAVIRIEDEGPGIAPEAITAMIEPFKRGEASRNRATGGAGLGLTLARAIAEQHGGRLALSNRAEGGLCAEIRLPVR